MVHLEFNIRGSIFFVSLKRRTFTFNNFEYEVSHWALQGVNGEAKIYLLCLFVSLPNSINGGKCYHSAKRKLSTHAYGYLDLFPFHRYLGKAHFTLLGQAVLELGIIQL